MRSTPRAVLDYSEESLDVLEKILSEAAEYASETGPVQLQNMSQ
jgi:hypothetical protein